MQGLKQRLITGILFVLLTIGGVAGGRCSFALLFLLVTVACLWEFLTMALPEKQPKRKFIGIVLGVLPYLATGIWRLYPNAEPWVLLFLGAIFFVGMLALFWLEMQSPLQPFASLGAVALGVIYIGIPFALFLFFGVEEYNYQWRRVVAVLSVVWLFDTASYFMGSMFGRRPLWPALSPKKTWEGAIGGLAITLLLAAIIGPHIDPLPVWQWLILASLTSLAGLLGDLAESMLKRYARVKDSGGLLPGHGGLLDRYDGFLFALPAAALFYAIINM